MSLLINHFYRFGEFILDTEQRILLRDGKPLPLAPKVFDTLLILVENKGRVVTKEELMTQLWPDTFVEEANLTYSIQQLRKSLGDNARNPIYIETIPRRGYRFIVDVKEVLSDSAMADNRVARRFEAPDVESRDGADQLNGQPTVPGPETAITLPNATWPVSPESNLDAPPASSRASTPVSKRAAALAVAAVIVLAGVGLILWKLSNGSNKNLSEDKRVDGKTVVASPLKLEKLTGTGQSRHVAISPDGKYVAYTRHFEKKTSIWLRQLATNTNVEIVPATGRVSGLAFTTSGEYLYFVRGDPTALYRVSLVGGVPTKLVDKLEGIFSISADDSQIAFIRQAINRDGQREYSLIIANSDGTGERTLLVGTYPHKLDVPVWSPDSRSIICVYGSSEGGGQDVSIVEVRVADGAKREMSADRFFRVAKMAWLPDKSGLIMSARKNLGDNNQLWQVSYPGIEISQISEGLFSYLDLSIASGADKAVASQATRISDIWVGSSHDARNLKKITQAIDNFCWTPSGQLIYTSTASGNRDLWIMEPDGTKQRQLTVNAAVNGAPAVTPDNRYVVFTSNRTGALQVWRMNLDGSNQIQLTNGAAKDCPAISPDGKWVLYNTTDDWHLWRVSIDGGDPLRLTDYIASRPSVSLDGKVIACVGRNQSRNELLILPIEGGQPLRKIEFAGGSFSDTRIQWAEDGKALVYADNRDGVRVLIRQPLDGGPPEEIITFDEDELFDFGYSVDRQSFAVTRGGWQHDIVLISDLNRH